MRRFRPRRTPGPVGPAAVDAAPGRPVVHLHVGAPKTGTTYLQRLLWQNRDRLRADGVLFPGESFAAHTHAAFDLRDAGFHGHQDPGVAGAWSRLVDQCREWGGPAVISQELFSPASPAQVDRAMADLSFAEVHVVYTARALVRQIPAAWQEDLKNRFAPTLEEFVRALRNPRQDDRGLGRMFWSMQDAPEVLRRWGRGLPTDRVHVVTVPVRPDPPELLWQRFAAVIGVDASRYALQGEHENTSLGAAEAAVVRRINLALADEIGWPLYGEMIKHHVADVLAARPGAQRIVLAAKDATWAANRGGEIVDALQEAGYPVVGSLDELRADPPGPDAPQTPPAPALEDQLDAAVAAVAAIMLRVSRLRRGVIGP